MAKSNYKKTVLNELTDMANALYKSIQRLPEKEYMKRAELQQRLDAIDRAIDVINSTSDAQFLHVCKKADLDKISDPDNQLTLSL